MADSPAWAAFVGKIVVPKARTALARAMGSLRSKEVELAIHALGEYDGMVESVTALYIAAGMTPPPQLKDISWLITKS